MAMDRNDVLPLVRSVNNDTNDPAYTEVRETLRQLDEAELFHALFPCAVKSPHQTPGFPVYHAGQLLFDLNPACQISCVEAVRATIAGWDISLEEVPFYIYRQFGMNAVQEAINQLRGEPLSNQQRVQLDTVKYWVEIIDREGIEAIQESRS